MRCSDSSLHRLAATVPTGNAFVDGTEYLHMIWRQAATIEILTTLRAPRKKRSVANRGESPMAHTPDIPPPAGPPSLSPGEVVDTAR